VYGTIEVCCVTEPGGKRLDIGNGGGSKVFHRDCTGATWAKSSSVRSSTDPVVIGS
jgi:hypothetical protein